LSLHRSVPCSGAYTRHGRRRPGGHDLSGRSECQDARCTDSRAGRNGRSGVSAHPVRSLVGLRRVEPARAWRTALRRPLQLGHGGPCSCRVSRTAGAGIAWSMSLDERSSGEQYPGPKPSESGGQSSDREAAPDEHGHGPRGDREPNADGADETVEVGEAAESFRPRLGRPDAMPEKDEHVEPPVEPAGSD
jgi:hypothetical protein